MFYNNDPAKINRFTKPHFFQGGDKAILLIHGYTGSPREMLWLGTQLHKAGYTVSIPRLPGHGTNKEDFIYPKHIRRYMSAVSRWEVC